VEIYTADIVCSPQEFKSVSLDLYVYTHSPFGLTEITLRIELLSIREREREREREKDRERERERERESI
jgi:hypothetical protein